MLYTSCMHAACTFVDSESYTYSYTGAVPMFTCMQHLCLKIYFVFHYLVQYLLYLQDLNAQACSGFGELPSLNTAPRRMQFSIMISECECTSTCMPLLTAKIMLRSLVSHVHVHAIADRKDNAEKLSIYIATYGDEPVNLQELLLNI